MLEQWTKEERRVSRDAGDEGGGEQSNMFANHGNIADD